MKAHVQIVAALHIALGVSSLLGAAAIFVALSIAGGAAAVHGEHDTLFFVILAVAIGSFLTLLALPGIIGGWGLFSGRSWAKPLLLVVAIFDLIHVPFGTALGVYTLWALLREPERPLPSSSAVQPAS